MVTKNFEKQYAEALRDVLDRGCLTEDRTGTGRYRISGQTFAFPSVHYLHDWKASLGLPLLKGKKVYPKMAIKEMVWMLSGKTNVDFLHKHGVTYWDEWADQNGELGKVYGHQFRNFNGFDQLNYVASNLRKNWTSTQMLINLWNGANLGEMALPPCHFSYFFQALKYPGYVKPTLHIHLVQRSADSFLGVPYNAIMVTFFLHIMAIYADMIPGNVYWTLHDFHIYRNHVDQVKQYLKNYGENKYGTIGLGAFLYFDDESKKLLRNTDAVSPVRPLDDFFEYCDNQGFKNIEIPATEGYGEIKADIAV